MGRIGRLKTSHGIIETPYIFPVVDPTLKRQFVSLEVIKNIGFNGIITNAYLLKKNVNKVVDIHNYLNFDGVVMTDSGAYQVLRYGGIEVSNREIVQYQCDIRSDIAVILDIPTPYNVSYEEALRSAEITYQRAMEVADIINLCKDTLWTLPIQGGTYINILKEYAKKSANISGYGYSIYALGSPTTLLENYMLDKVVEMIVAVRLTIEPSSPLHLFGAGHPLIMPFAIALGVDLMDSASYILYARDKRYMTKRGTYKITELRYLPCSCPICSKHTVEEMMKMTNEELTKLLALHNLYVLYTELKEIKECIREGRLWEYLEERARAHPATKRAFDVIKKYLEHIYSRSPYKKPRGKGVFILSDDSIYNPKIMIPRRKILIEITPKRTCVVFVPLTKFSNARFNVHLHYTSILNEVNKIYESKVQPCDMYLYHPIIGIVPSVLLAAYPFSQFESYTTYSPTSIKTLVYTLIEYIIRITKDCNVDKNVVLIYDYIEWQYVFGNLLEAYINILKSKNIDIEIVKIKRDNFL